MKNDEARSGFSAVPLDIPVMPVAWRTFDGEGGYDYRSYEDNEDYGRKWKERYRHTNTYDGWVEPLYVLPTAPTPELIDAVCRATLMSKTTAEYAVLAVLKALGVAGHNAM